MPYKRIGNTIYTKATGTWKVKQVCKSVDAAKRALKLLQGLEHRTITKDELTKYRNRTKKRLV